MVDRGISRIFTPEPARLSTQHVQRGDQVETGTLLVELDSPDLLHEIALAEQKIKQLETEHRRRAGSKEQLRSDLITQHQLEELREELQGLVLRKQRLRVVAPVNGRVSHIKSMSEGQWLNQHRPLLIIQSNEGAQFHGFVAEESVHRFDVGAPGVWVTDSGTSRSIEVEVSQIERTALPTLPYSELASDFGGPIAVRRSRQDELRTEQGVYRITLSPLSPLPSPTQRQSGIIQIEGERQSIVRQLMTHVAAVLMRESGF